MEGLLGPGHCEQSFSRTSFYSCSSRLYELYRVLCVNKLGFVGWSNLLKLVTQLVNTESCDPNPDIFTEQHMILQNSCIIHNNGDNVILKLSEIWAIINFTPVKYPPKSPIGNFVLRFPKNENIGANMSSREMRRGDF